MYNRYVPKNDGTFQRRAMDEHPKTPHSEPATTPPPQQVQPQPVPIRPQNSPAGFFRNLLPKNFDTGDLIIVLLLLLMAGDCVEEQNTALLTLALYFFM